MSVWFLTNEDLQRLQALIGTKAGTDETEALRRAFGNLTKITSGSFVGTEQSGNVFDLELNFSEKPSLFLIYGAPETPKTANTSRYRETFAVAHADNRWMLGFSLSHDKNVNGGGLENGTFFSAETKWKHPTFSFDNITQVFVPGYTYHYYAFFNGEATI